MRYGMDKALRERLADLEALVKNQEYLLSQAVRETLQAGATWQDVGKALGVSAEFAEARFGTGGDDPAP